MGKHDPVSAVWQGRVPKLGAWSQVVLLQTTPPKHSPPPVKALVKLTRNVSGQVFVGWSIGSLDRCFYYWPLPDLARLLHVFPFGFSSFSLSGKSLFFRSEFGPVAS